MKRFFPCSLSAPRVWVALALLCAVLFVVAPGAMAQDSCGDPDPNVEATPKPDPKPIVWSPDTGISGGKMTAPQDQTHTPYSPERVIVGPGEEIPAAVTVASDTDSWTRDDDDPCTENSGSGLDGITYSWTASGGEFTGGTNGPSASWKAPKEPGRYTLTCEIDDIGAISGNAEGSRDDGGISASCEVIVPSLSIRFTQGTLAIGSKDNAAHQAKFEVTASDGNGGVVPDIDVPTPKVVDGGRDPYKGISASVEMDTSVTDSNGIAKGKLTSGNRVESTTIQIITDPDHPENGGPSASAEQVWNELGDDSWSFDPYFYYDESSTIYYRMAFQRDGVENTIPGHSMEPETTVITGYEWDPTIGEDWDGDGAVDGDYRYETYSINDADSTGYDAWNDLVQWGGVSDSDGTYAVDQTIAYHEDFEVDSVSFWLWDNDSYGENGAEN